MGKAKAKKADEEAAQEKKKALLSVSPRTVQGRHTTQMRNRLRKWCEFIRFSQEMANVVEIEACEFFPTEAQAALEGAQERPHKIGDPDTNTSELITNLFLKRDWMHETARCFGYRSDSTRAARERAREATCGHRLRRSGPVRPGPGLLHSPSQAASISAPVAHLFAASRHAPVAQLFAASPLAPVAQLRPASGTAH